MEKTHRIRPVALSLCLWALTASCQGGRPASESTTLPTVEASQLPDSSRSLEDAKPTAKLQPKDAAGDSDAMSHKDFKFDPRIFGKMEDFHPEVISGGFKSKKARVVRNVLKNVRMEVCLLSTQVCAPFPQCGAFVTCGSPMKVVVCQGCGSIPKNGPPANVCDFRSGRCAANKNATAGISGTMCTKTGKCKGKGLQCRDDRNNRGQKRCCRSQCPPGAYGSPDFWYTNECGDRILCPNGYRPT